MISRLVSYDRFPNLHIKISTIEYFYIHKKLENLFLWFIWKIPRNICLWCFVRVCSASGESPCSITYKSAYDFWENQTKMKNARNNEGKDNDKKAKIA